MSGPPCGRPWPEVGGPGLRGLLPIRLRIELRMMPRHHWLRCYDVTMRTTLTIDDDVLDTARSVAERLNTPFRRVINEALRAGLQAVEQPGKTRPYTTHPHKLGLKGGRSLDNIQELLAQVEGEAHR